MAAPDSPLEPSGRQDGQARPVRRAALGEFLRTVRARVTPESVSLPPGSRRRTPGLRREEVAQLGGISVTWYTWIEQGRDVSVSPAVWARLANVLHLTRAERHYLFELAECADPEHGGEHVDALPEGLRDCVNGIIVPAYVLDRCWNVLARNEPLLHLFGGWPDRVENPNLLHYIFLDPAAKQLVVDWESRARRVVAEFRADVAAYADEPEVREMIDGLSRDSAVFAHWWGRQAVVEREGGSRAFRHPGKGELNYRQITFRSAIRPDCKLVMLMTD